MAIHQSHPIKIKAGTVEKTISIDEDFVDCNTSLHSILLADDEIKEFWESALAIC